MFAICRLVACCLLLLAAPGSATAQTTPQAYPGDRLAYVSGGKLYVGFPKARLVPGPGNVFQPDFSYDGQWLAFLRGAHLWLARADGGSAHPVSSVGRVRGFQWSPSADVLAVQPQRSTGPVPTFLIPVGGRPRTLPHRVSGFFLWSPDGQELAGVTPSPGGPGQLAVLSGRTVRSYRLPGAGRHDLVNLVGWWPGDRGILYWIDPGGCNSCVVDGVPLLDYDLQTHTILHLGVTLAYPDWIAAHGNRLLLVTGGPRSAFFGKHLELCLGAGPCKTLVGSRAHHIAIDPAWSPAGNQVAFVVAPAWNTWGFQSPARYRRWLGEHVLWIANANGSGAHPEPAGVLSGIEDPVWTHDGRGILFVKDGALWLDSHLGAGNAHLIARLVPVGSVPNPGDPPWQGWYYGHMNWHDLFAWY